MRRPDQLLHKNMPYYIPCIPSRVLPEKIILDLHDMFLTKEFHQLAVPTYSFGRNLIVEITKSIRFYQNVGYLSLMQHKVYEKSSFHDIYAILTTRGYLNDGCTNFEEFFIEEFFFDLLIIEHTQELQSQLWYTPFVQSIYDLSLNTQLPIIALQEERNSFS